MLPANGGRGRGDVVISLHRERLRGAVRFDQVVAQATAAVAAEGSSPLGHRVLTGPRRLKLGFALECSSRASTMRSAPDSRSRATNEYPHSWGKPVGIRR